MVASGLCTVGNHTHTHARPELLTEEELDAVHRRGRAAPRRAAAALRLHLGRRRAADASRRCARGSAAPPPARSAATCRARPDAGCAASRSAAPTRSRSSGPSCAAALSPSAPTAPWSRLGEEERGMLTDGLMCPELRGPGRPAAARRPPHDGRHEPGAAARHRARGRRRQPASRSSASARRALRRPRSRRSGSRHVPLPALTRSWDPRTDLRRGPRADAACCARCGLDVLHTHNPKTGVLGRLLGPGARGPVVVNTCHGLWAGPEDRLAQAARGARRRGGGRAVLPRRALPERRGPADAAPAGPQRRARVVGNGIDLDAVPAATRRAAARVRPRAGRRRRRAARGRRRPAGRREGHRRVRRRGAAARRDARRSSGSARTTPDKPDALADGGRDGVAVPRRAHRHAGGLLGARRVRAAVVPRGLLPLRHGGGRLRARRWCSPTSAAAARSARTSSELLLVPPRDAGALARPSTGCSSTTRPCATGSARAARRGARASSTSARWRRCRCRPTRLWPGTAGSAGRWRGSHDRGG